MAESSVTHATYLFPTSIYMFYDIFLVLHASKKQPTSHPPLDISGSPLLRNERPYRCISPFLSLSLSLHWLIWAVGINRLFKCVTWFLFFPLSSLNIQFPLSKSFSTPLYMYYFFFPFSFVALGAFSFLGFICLFFSSPNHTFNNWFFLFFFSSSSPPPLSIRGPLFFLSCLKLCRTHIPPPFSLIIIIVHLLHVVPYFGVQYRFFSRSHNRGVLLLL